MARPPARVDSDDRGQTDACDSGMIGARSIVHVASPYVPHVHFTLAMTSRRFAQIDVFSARAGYGNPLAVVLDAEGLDAKAMQCFAAWTNLSETTFVLAPTTDAADFRVRIFTPRRELPFAGHPTVGTTYAVLAVRPDLLARTRLTLECAAGLLPVRVEGEGARRRIFVQAPTASIGVTEPALIDAFASALGARPKADPAPRAVDNGPVWLIGELADAAAVRALHPDLDQVAALTTRHKSVGLCAFGRETAGDAAIAVRAFCPADGIPEDPVTGSANAAIGAFLHATHTLAEIGLRYRASQGREVGRDGYVDVEINAHSGAVEIGGDCVSCITGQVNLD